MTHTRRLILLLTALLSVLPLSGQPRTREFRTLCDTLAARLKRRTTVDYRLSVSKVQVSGKTLNLTFNNNLSYFPWHEQDVTWFREELGKEWTWKDYSPGKILTNKYELEELATPALGSNGKPSADYAFKTDDPRQTQARFIERVDARRWLKGLNDRYIMVWQSHGRYYDEAQDEWIWQRAPIHRTIEEM